MTRFVILAVPRTGSNLLCTLLNSHPQILCHHEVFNPQGVFVARDYQGAGLTVDSLQDRDQDPLRFLERVWLTATTERGVGFKWTRGQNQEVFRSVVEDPDVKKIVLHRGNRIKTFVSDRIAQQTQQWEAYSRQELAMPRPRIDVDVAQLLEHIATNQRFYAELSADLTPGLQPSMEVQYERLFDRDVQSRLLEFLEVSPQESSLSAASIKQNSTDLRHLIANFAELAASLSDKALVDELNDCGI